MDFLLVHEAWHDGSLWEPVAAPLRAAGHAVHAPTVAGHGPGASHDIDHARCTASLVQYIVAHDLGRDGDLVLVGHGFGGTFVSKVAEALPERLSRLVYLNGIVLEDGESMRSVVPESYRELFTGLAEGSDDASLAMPFRLWREAFMNDADLETARRTWSWLSPQPAQPFDDVLDLKKFYSLQLPASYLHCTEDTALPPGDYGLFPRMANRLGLYRLVQMPGGHETLFTAPVRLAAKLVDAGRP
jgi:pimeloyl-ACP methyl ester carboxylesterase